MAAAEVEIYKLYNGEVEVSYYPNSHMYKVGGKRIIGVTTVTGIINKEALMLYPLSEAIRLLTRELVEKPKAMKEKTITHSLDDMSKILETAKAEWRLKNKRGTDAGTQGHAWLEEFLRAKRDGESIPEVLKPIEVPKLPEWDDEYIRAIDYNNIVEATNKLIEWFKEKDVTVLEVEKLIYSRKYDYCGRFDAVLRINGKVYLVDFKTSNPAREYPNGIYPENFFQTGGYDIAYSEEFPDAKIDGHLVINLSKKSGKINFKYDFDRKTNRDAFLYSLGTKRAMQKKIQENSMMYAENRPGKKK